MPLSNRISWSIPLSGRGRSEALQPCPGVLVSDESVGRGEPNFGQGALGIEKIELAELAFAIADPRDAGCLLSGCQSRPVGCPRVCSGIVCFRTRLNDRSEEHTSELPSLMRISYAVFCLKKKINQ